MFKIIEKSSHATGINRFVIEVPEIAKKVLPGQFTILRLHEKGERIPITVADSDKVKGTITLFVQEVGKTTIEMGKLKTGDTILDVVGPLGVLSHIENFGTVLCIAGGVGVAVMYPIAKALKEKGNKIISILGARSKNFIILENEIKKNSDEFFLTTDDGSYGQKGFVSNVLNDLLAIRHSPLANIVYAIGPVPMMRVISEITKQHNLKTIVSLNPIMVDGTGMCGACRVSVGGVTKFACVDGPDFDGHLVNWTELTSRLSVFKREEKESLDHYCKYLKTVRNS
ncbi:MAG: sulfide/dihydroorotate dehydrogenase-like FAD/NAD-binding protein [Elusimicrobia bacterium]|nr:sulfide/dihydroorotate dehydrogenase-like FAD/NAD-binding protein [Elusimicrobiota bacterium]